MIPQLLTVDEAAEILKVRKKWLQTQITEGKLPAIKMGHQTLRIKMPDLEAFIESNYTTTA